MSITAAKGIPKLEAGPQKSVLYCKKNLSARYTLYFVSQVRRSYENDTICDANSQYVRREKLNSDVIVKRTCREDIVEDFVRANLRIDGFDSGRHGGRGR